MTMSVQIDFLRSKVRAKRLHALLLPALGRKVILGKKLQHFALLQDIRSSCQEAAVKLSTLIITVGINYKRIKPKVSGNVVLLITACS